MRLQVAGCSVGLSLVVAVEFRFGLCFVWFCVTLIRLRCYDTLCILLLTHLHCSVTAHYIGNLLTEYLLNSARELQLS